MTNINQITATEIAVTSYTSVSDSTTPVVAVETVIPGLQGASGASAYQAAVEQGFQGTKAQWLASLATEANGIAMGYAQDAGASATQAASSATSAATSASNAATSASNASSSALGTAVAMAIIFG